MNSRFTQQQEVTFYDTAQAGGISIRGIQLTTDEDGCIMGPPSLEEELRPHGFVRMDREQARKLQPAQPQQVAQQHQQNRNQQRR